MARARHPKNEVEKALKGAEEAGWNVTPTTAGHRFGWPSVVQAVASRLVDAEEPREPCKGYPPGS